MSMNSFVIQITILQLSGLLKQPDTSSRKLTLNRLSSTALPFTIVSIQSNVENEDALAVCGLKDCHVITYGHGGSVASHIALPLQLETGNFVIKAVWVPGEQTKIALLTADFVKVVFRFLLTLCFLYCCKGVGNISPYY